MRHLTKLTAALSLAGAFATSAIAAPVTYAVDSGHSFPNFSYQHMGLSVQLSKFDKTTGTVTLDKAAKTASVDVVIDTTSVNTGSTVFNGHIQGKTFLTPPNTQPPRSNRPKWCLKATSPPPLKVT